MKTPYFGLSLSLALALALPCCNAPDAPGPAPSTKAPPQVAQAADPASTAAAAPARTSQPAAAAPDAPAEPFKDGERAFRMAKENLLKRYNAEGLTEDELYLGALRGMLEHVEPRMAKWNTVLSPAEILEMRSELKGEVVGVGLRLRFEPSSGHATVLEVIVGSPAERAGLVAGDEVLSVDGKVYRGLRERDLLGAIRGAAGSRVELAVLRGDEVLRVPLVRERVSMVEVSSTTLPDAVAYLHLRSFTQRSAAAAREALEAAARGGARALIVDLRGNRGGALDDAVATAGVLLPDGTTVALIERRAEGRSPSRTKGPPVEKLPLVVLVDGTTSSGAEFVAESLRQARGAKLVGARTFGKWSVQSVEDLPNGYAIKFTIGRTYSASGKTYDGVGLSPDVEVSAEPSAAEHARSLADAAARLEADPQLRAAHHLLRALSR